MAKANELFTFQFMPIIDFSVTPSTFQYPSWMHQDARSMITQAVHLNPGLNGNYKNGVIQSDASLEDWAIPNGRQRRPSAWMLKEAHR